MTTVAPFRARGKKLPRAFYLRDDVVTIARELLGKVLVTRLDGGITSGLITETEAYAGIGDRASHAYGGRRTRRNGPMYAQGGTAYVYLCYGMHHLFNVVTNEREVPHAVLVRAIHPIEGMDLMRVRRDRPALTTNGPGTLSKALGIHTGHSGIDLLGDTIYMEDRAVIVPANLVSAGPRIGVDYAGEDARLPYRFRFDPHLLG